MRMQYLLALALTVAALACGGDDEGVPSDASLPRDARDLFDDDVGPGEDDLAVPLTITMGTLPSAETRFAALCQTWVGEGEIVYSLVASPSAPAASCTRTSSSTTRSTPSSPATG